MELLLKAGTRSSQLARVQTRDALDRLEALFEGCRFEDVPLSSPGDRDRQTDLRASDPDFFTRDLDDLVLNGTLDCAVHSAKDVPDPVRAGLDWFWLPWRADPRDALCLARGRAVADLPDDARIGVSSERRETYCRQRFPNARQCPIRGNVDARLQQLDNADYDMVVIASAALVRLGRQDRITEWISVEDLPPPDGQGYLCITFRADDARFLRLRAFFTRAVTFAGGGVGGGDMCTLAVLKALRRCDVVLHDTLMGPDLLNHVPPHVTRIPVGKRAGRHSVPQDEITELITRYARRGLRTVRLKGGDPGVFGRLAEEVDALDALHLPYHVLPGVSSLTAATTMTGMLLTRRGHSRGFCAMTPRLAGGGVVSVASAARAELPIVFYMAVSVSPAIAQELIDDGLAPDTPAAVVFGAGGDQAHTISGTLADIGERAAGQGGDMPGTLVVGDVAGYRYHTEWGALAGRRILLTCSEALQDHAAGLISDFGGVPVCRPLVRLVPSPKGQACLRDLAHYDWVVLTSPSAVRCFGDLLRAGGTDVRTVPTLVSCGGGTSAALAVLGFKADIEPDETFGAESLLKAAQAHITPQTRILRLRSDKAGPHLADALRSTGATVDDCVLYHNQPVPYNTRPEFDAVFFASASAVEAFDTLWSMDALAGSTVLAIGKPTLAALTQRNVTDVLVGHEATVESALASLALQAVNGTVRD